MHAAGDPRWGGLPAGTPESTAPAASPTIQRIHDLKMELAGLAAKGAGAPDSLRRELSQLSGLPIPAQGQSPTAAQGVPAAQGAGVVPQYQQGN